MIIPDDLAKSGTEHGQQAALFCWASLRRDLAEQLRWMHAIPNGGQRNKVTAALLKAEGVKSGVVDIFLPYPISRYHGLYLEMKVGGNTPSDEQVQFMNTMKERGYHIALCYHWRAAATTILMYLNVPISPLEPYRELTEQQKLIGAYKRDTIGWHRP